MSQKKRQSKNERAWNLESSQNPAARGPGGLGYLIIPTMEEWEERLTEKRRRKKSSKSCP